MVLRPCRNYIWEAVACFHQQNILPCWNHGTEKNIWLVKRLYSFLANFMSQPSIQLFPCTYPSWIYLFWCSSFGKLFEDVIAHYVHPEKCMKKWKLSNETQPFTYFLIFTNPLSIIEIRSGENVKKLHSIDMFVSGIISWSI